MEQELRKCYEDYLYNNTKLAELIMTESANGHVNGRDDVFDNNNDTNKYRIHDSLQNILRRRSITPPPEYQCRLDPINHYLRTMGNGSTSTLSSSISNASNSTNCSSIITNSSNHSLSSSSTSSSSMFRTHRFIPNIISHQAQKMAQHFRSSNSSHKKDSIGSLKDGKTSNNNNENQTILSFLFGLSLGSGSGLKRSESVSNINRINHNILLPKNYDLVPNSSSTPKKSSDRHLNVSDQNIKYRKHSVNDEIITASTSQMFSNVNTGTFDGKSQTNANESRKSPSDSPQTYSSPKRQLNSKLMNNVITGKLVKQPPPPMDNGQQQQQPPPLPPKTYRPNGTPTTSISSSSSGSFNNSGRSSIASNTSSMSSSSSLTSHSTGSSLSMGHHYRCSKDTAGGDSGLSSALPSNSSGEFQANSTIGQSSSVSSTSSVGSINLSNKTDEHTPVNSKENTDDTITVVANDTLATYSQVTLRPKKVRRNHQAIIINNNVVNHSGNIPNCNRCSSPPPLPPPDSLCTSSNNSSSPRCVDSLITNNNSKEFDIAQCYCCCCKQQTSGLVNGGTVGQIRQIRTYRKPNTQTTRNSSESSSNSITANHKPLSFTKSCSSLGSMALNRHCNQHLMPNECCKQSQFHCSRPTLVHSVTMNETSFGASSNAPPPLPPKRNLHAYMGMVGNYTGPGSELNHHSTIRSTKSMFCGSNVTNLHPVQMLAPRKLSSETNTTVSSCSISTNFSNSGSSSSPSQSLIGSDRAVVIEDEYQHLPMAPPPPTTSERDLPSPPPILPPRRDKLAPPPPPIQRSITISRCTNNLNNINNNNNNSTSICHYHYHCHCLHNQSFEVCHRSASIGSNEDSLPTDDQSESLNLFNSNDQKSEQLATLDSNNEPNDIVNVNEVEMEIVEEEITCCPYCSEGTVHSEDECILAQVDVPPDLFTYQSDDGLMGNDNSSKSFGDSNEIGGGTIDALLIKAIQASLTAGQYFIFFS